MKVSIVNVQVPFVARCGSQYLAESLGEKIRARGHRVDQLRIPFRWHPHEMIPEHMLACRLLDPTTGDPDLVIALKFPAYLVPFENKKVWLLHQYRQVYEPWDTPCSDPDTPRGTASGDVRAARHGAALRGAGALHQLADRRRPALPVQRARARRDPVPAAAATGACSAAARPGLRLLPEPDLQLQAAARGRRGHALRAVRLPARPGRQGRRGRLRGALDELIRAHGLEDRVELLGWISEEEKARLMADAFAVDLPPLRRGLVRLRDARGLPVAKPVITFADSGGHRRAGGARPQRPDPAPSPRPWPRPWSNSGPTAPGPGDGPGRPRDPRPAADRLGTYSGHPPLMRIAWFTPFRRGRQRHRPVQRRRVRRPDGRRPHGRRLRPRPARRRSSRPHRPAHRRPRRRQPRGDPPRPPGVRPGRLQPGRQRRLPRDDLRLCGPTPASSSSTTW